MQFAISSYQSRTFFDTSGDRKVVAVCDNDTTTRAIVCDVLEKHGYMAFGCDVAIESIALIQRYSPDLVLLDMSPSQLMGLFAFLEQLHTAPATANVPVVVASADQELLRQEWWRRGDREYDVIPKPFDKALLLETIAHRLSQGLLERCSSSTA